MSDRSCEDNLTAGRFAGARQPLGEASTLPAEAFTSPAVYEREIERIFLKEWLCAGRVDQVAKAGDYFTLDLLGDKLVIVRGTDEEIRVLSRICRHRAAEVVKGAGNARSFQCPYHAWTYRLDGMLQGAPLMDERTAFDRDNCRLPQIRSEIWEGWIFVNFDPDADPLGPQLAPLSKFLANYPMSEMVAIETATFDSPYNWKVLMDNFMEAYHHIATHRQTLEPLFPGKLSSTPDNEGPYSLLLMPDKNQEASSEKAEPLFPEVGDLDEDEARRLTVGAIFPSHLFAPAAGNLTWYQILPEAVDRFTLRIFACFPGKTLDDEKHADLVKGFQEYLKIIHNEDIGACEAVWAGLDSRSFEAGPLSHLEKPIWQFNQWWMDRMVDAGE
jgi:phenylpropionate dioxygenase-like ring-hydroxylating dioxygenase large terminal subunit